MLFFLDSANLSEIKTASDTGLLSGVTTNPTLMAKEGVRAAEFPRHIDAIAEVVQGPVSAEVVATEASEMVAEAERLAKTVNRHLVIKIPCTQAGLLAIRQLTRKGFQTNCTLVFNAVQALLAAKAGATYVSPFVGRLDDTLSPTRAWRSSWRTGGP